MTVPQNTVYSDGGAPVTGENANTFVQICDVASTLRNFVAGSSNMAVLLLGTGAIGDGNGGLFQWQSGVTGTDDNLNVIVPGGGAGSWVRIPLKITL